MGNAERLLTTDIKPNRQLSENSSVIRRPENARSELPIKEFTVPENVLESLTENEREILITLSRSVRRVADLYLLQESPDERAHFYPDRVTKKEIREANRMNPEILSHYTIVGRDNKNGLVANPMHEIYKGILKEKNIPGLLREAARKAGVGKKRDLMLQGYLNAKASSLENGNYKASERIWLERENEPTLDIAIGLYDTYTDRFLERKYSWQAWCGVLDKEKTVQYQQDLDTFLSWWEQKNETSAPMVKMRIDHTRIMSGQAARYSWTGNSLPCQIEWREELGSKFTIFEPIFKDKLGERITAYRSVIEPTRRMGVTDELIERSSLRRYIFHETGHALGIAPDIDERLDQHTAWIKELYCDLISLDGYSQAAITDVNMREREVAFATLLANGILEYKSYTEKGEREEYCKSNSIILKYFLETGSVQIIDGLITWDDPRAVMRDVSSLFVKVNTIQRSGTISQADKLQKDFFNPDIYKNIQSA